MASPARTTGNAPRRADTPVGRSAAPDEGRKGSGAKAGGGKKSVLGCLLDQIRLATPSFTTLVAVGLGIGSIAQGRLAFHDNKTADKAAETACWLIVAAFAIDFFDGALARALGACSATGAALDFLADSTAYVLAPSLLLPALCGNVGWAFGAMWLGFGAYRSSRQEGEDVKGDRKAGRFFGLISNHAATQLGLSVIVSLQWGLRLHRRPEVIGFFVVPLCMAMITPLWYWKITYGPAWWSKVIYPFLIGVLACAYFQVGAEVLLAVNSLYLILGPTVDERFYMYLPYFANITCCMSGGLSILVGVVFPGSFKWWERPGWWICVAFVVDSVCALATTHRSTKALRLQCGFVSFTIAPIFLFIDAPSEPLTWVACGSFLMSSLYRRTVAVAGQVDIATESRNGVPSALCGALLAAIHFAGHTPFLVHAGMVMSVAMVAPIPCFRQDQEQSGSRRLFFWVCHSLVLVLMAIGRKDEAVGVLVVLTAASLALSGA